MQLFRRQRKNTNDTGEGIRDRVRRSWQAHRTAIWSWLSITLVVLMIALPLCLLGWLVFFTDIFEIQAITVVDAKPHTTEAVKHILETQTQNVPLHRNIFFLQTDALEAAILSEVPQVRTVHVTSKLPGTVKATIQEKIPVLLLLSNGHYYLIDDKGIAYEESRLDTLPNIVLPTIKNNDTAAEVTLGVPMVSEAFVSFVQSIQTKLPKILPITIVSIQIPSLAAREVSFFLNNNWEIRFDVTRDSDSQLSILKQLLQGTITADEQKGLEYIDLRIPDRVYYKSRTSIPVTTTRPNVGKATPTHPPDKAEPPQT